MSLIRNWKVSLYYEYFYNRRLQLPLGINGEGWRFLSTPNGLTSSINQSSKKQQSKWRSINCQVCGILDEKINEEGFSNLLRTMLNILVLVGTRYNDNFSPVELTFQRLKFQKNFCLVLSLCSPASAHTVTGTQNGCLLHKPYWNRGILTRDKMS